MFRHTVNKTSHTERHVMTAQELRSLGLERIVELGLAISSTESAATRAANDISNVLEDHPTTSVRIAAVGRSTSRVSVTLAVTLGTIEAIKLGSPEVDEAMALLKQLVDDLATYDPAFTTLPDQDSFDARIASYVEDGELTLETSMAALASHA